MSLINRQVTSKPVLLLHGGSPAAREGLLSHLKSSTIGFELVELPAHLSSAAVDGDNVTTFLRDTGAGIGQLTPKEDAVLKCILTGQTTKAISQQLALSIRTIEFRKASIMKKLKASSHTELVSRVTRFQTLQKYLIDDAQIQPATNDTVVIKKSVKPIAGASLAHATLANADQ